MQIEFSTTLFPILNIVHFEHTTNYSCTTINHLDWQILNNVKISEEIVMTQLLFLRMKCEVKCAHKFQVVQSMSIEG